MVPLGSRLCAAHRPMSTVSLGLQKLTQCFCPALLVVLAVCRAPQIILPTPPCSSEHYRSSNTHPSHHSRASHCHRHTWAGGNIPSGRKEREGNGEGLSGYYPVTESEM